MSEIEKEGVSGQQEDEVSTAVKSDLGRVVSFYERPPLQVDIPKTFASQAYEAEGLLYPSGTAGSVLIACTAFGREKSRGIESIDSHMVDQLGLMTPSP